jgi:hypothetical protein
MPCAPGAHGHVHRAGEGAFLTKFCATIRHRASQLPRSRAKTSLAHRIVSYEAHGLVARRKKSIATFVRFIAMNVY